MRNLKIKFVETTFIFTYLSSFFINTLKYKKGTLFLGLAMILKPHIIQWHLNDTSRLKIKLSCDCQYLEEENKGEKSSFDEQNLQKSQVLAVKNENSAENTTDALQSLHVSLNNQDHVLGIVDGIEVPSDLKSLIKEEPALNLSHPWHLRKKRADLFISLDSKVDYLKSLLNYLNKFNLKILNYDPSVHYLPSDLLVLDADKRVEQGTVVYLNEGKRAVWDFLKVQLPEIFDNDK